MGLQQPFLLGSLSLRSNLFCAPLAGCSDFAFRKMTGKYRPGLFFCEMVKIDALVRHDAHTYRLLDYSPDMHPIGAQICGSKPAMAADAASIIEDLGFDCIDLNCGCPVDKVTKDGSGSGLLRTPELIGDILSAIVARVRIPVTLKIRAGWSEATINAATIATIAEAAGAQAITVHGRTREQAYVGPANWDFIRDVKQAVKNLLVIGNGDVVDGPSAERMFKHTNCDGVLLARGTLGQPWIVEDVERHLLGLPPLVRTDTEIKQTLLEHFDWIVRIQSEKQALLDMRRVGCWYLKMCVGAKPFRMQLNQARSLSEIQSLLKTL